MLNETEAELMDALDWVIRRDLRENAVEDERIWRRYYRRLLRRDAADALNRCDDCERRTTALRWIRGLSA